MPMPVNQDAQMNQNDDMNGSFKEGLDSIKVISDVRAESHAQGNGAVKADYEHLASQNKSTFGQIRDRDYIIVHGQTYTLDGLRGHFEQIRREAFGVPIEQYPLMRESEATLKKLDETEKYLYDSSPYNLDNPLADDRIKSRFEYMGNLIMGVGHAIDLVMTKKRQITSEYADLNAEWQLVYARAQNEYGNEMGKSDAARTGWMVWRYEALAIGYQMYGDFLKEIQVELDRLEEARQTSSRALAAFDSDAKQRNLFNDYKDEKSIR